MSEGHVDLAFFLGCLIPNRLPEIEVATRLVCERLGIGLNDMEGASCCPAPGVMRSFDKDLWLKISARNLDIASEMRMDIVTMCNGCYGTLKDSSMELKEDDALCEEIRASMKDVGRDLKRVVDVYHIVEYLYFDYGVEALSKHVTNKLDCKVAAHYGCHLLKPVKYRRETNFEDPSFFDELIEATGAKSIDYLEKNSCCGAGGGLRSGIKEVSLDIAKRKVATIKGADLIVTPCPFCHMQLEQVSDIPVLYYTQLLALSMGFSNEELGLEVKI
ncbi:MAG TPA: heterodisulfide reductase-related iron-sulfur binding cluster [Candidatus Methanofastidiosa archaeon]|nr:heterodisulfide reductase-related iron-sulfur binding cluster [Candidatus Methanofastidiosa archaeon]HPR42547.1 heterodisulfide reductase-related iron-sulfur binding cluster [Candidatus Methanofastidiosa archaeon]